MQLKLGSLIRPNASRQLRAFVICCTVLGCTVAASALRQGSNEVTACQSHLKQLSLGLLMYCQDYDEMYPPMRNADYVKPRVMPYIKNTEVFRCPSSQVDYQPNPALNYVALNSVHNPATMLAVRDAKAHELPEGKSGWNAGYVDGHVKLVNEEPALGKLAPAPKPVPRKKQLQNELTMLKRSLKYTQQRIRQIEAEMKLSGKGQ